MRTVIGLALLLWLVFLIYRDGRRALSRSTPGSVRPETRGPIGGRLDLHRLLRDMDTAWSADPPTDSIAPAGPEPGESAAEHREAELSRRLLDGAIEAPEYRRLMSELAHGTSPSRGAR